MNKTVQFLTELGTNAELKRAYDADPEAVLQAHGLDLQANPIAAEEAILNPEEMSAHKAILFTPEVVQAHKAILFTPDSTESHRHGLIIPQVAANKAILVVPGSN